MRSILLLVLAVVVSMSLVSAARAEQHRVSSAEQLTSALTAVQPGDTVVMADGLWTDQHLVLAASGTADKPLTLRAETPGKVRLNGASRLSIAGDHWIVQGLCFQGGALDGASVIEFRGPGKAGASHCVLRDCTIIDYNPSERQTRYFWVSLYGFDNVVENCRFSGQTHSGVTLVVWLRADEAVRHRIRRNHFADRPPGNANGFETIRIGTSGVSMTAAHCVVEENLFEECDGEIEIISNKSCDNVYRNNTFRRCAGTLTLRHGNRCLVEGNVFLGEDKRGTGGVRVIGESHRIIDNYFSGTRGRAGGAVSLQAGIPDSPLAGYFQVKDALIARNAFVDNRGSLFALDAGHGRRGATLLPQGVMIADNVMLVPENADPLIVATRPPEGIRWKDNVVVGNRLQTDLPAGIRITDAPPADLADPPSALSRCDVGPSWLEGT